MSRITVYVVKDILSKMISVFSALHNVKLVYRMLILVHLVLENFNCNIIVIVRVKTRFKQRMDNASNARKIVIIVNRNANTV
jgi:hypothetical protein